MKMKKMKRYQEGGSTEVEIEKKSSISDDIGLKKLPGLAGALFGVLDKNDLGGMGALGLVGKLMDRKKRREMGMPEDGSVTKIEIEKSKGMESPDMMGGGVAKYAKGGRIDGCAIKGKTKGTYR